MSTIFPGRARLPLWMDKPARITRMQEEDRRLSEILAEDRARLRDFIRKRVPNEADAEDLLQEVFYEVIAAYRLMAPVERWSAWMFRVARNRIIDRFRKRRPGMGSVNTTEDGEPSSWRMCCPRRTPDRSPPMREACSWNSKTPSTSYRKTSGSYSSRTRSTGSA